MAKKKQRTQERFNTTRPATQAKAPVTKAKKEFTFFTPRVFSRHPSHGPLRNMLGRLPFRSLIRLGSITESDRPRVECNSVAAVKTSADKLKMKTAFGQLPTAAWFHLGTKNNIDEIMAAIEAIGGFPIVVKQRWGSRGTGNTLVQNREGLMAWLPNKTFDNYIVEKFHNFNREYRLHVTAKGCFYTCRKVLKTETPENDRWRRHEDNCVWLLEDNEHFDRPANWKEIEKACVDGLKAVGLDIGAFDVKVQTARSAKGTTRTAPKFILLECNSAPSFGELTLEKYLVKLPEVLRDKAKTIK